MPPHNFSKDYIKPLTPRLFLLLMTMYVGTYFLIGMVLRNRLDCGPAILGCFDPSMLVAIGWLWLFPFVTIIGLFAVFIVDMKNPALPSGTKNALKVSALVFLTLLLFVFTTLWTVTDSEEHLFIPINVALLFAPTTVVFHTLICLYFKHSNK